MEASTNLRLSTRTRSRSRYAYEVRRCAKIMEVSSLDDATAALVLKWNTGLLGAGAITHMIWGNDPPWGTVTLRERSDLGNTETGVARAVGE